MEVAVQVAVEAACHVVGVVAIQDVLVFQALAAWWKV